ncbi:rod shape-determining protein MreC [Coriobacterium glomerans PW2]|uniref:Cell shape-determining protein MreC n=1 Tax=Coriobacterium glomerans (strain ATCC 49209 / DSM 20642 / JCM 10262 / PW2) TaxID=700015 RepID=F2N7S5_CORGP|nr:rod shape-determining protein MreC [Coriobacterium glomerans]AEB06967.1 rod shape-determining protein MreC [Coriobacterium glomerans PW2]
MARPQRYSTKPSSSRQATATRPLVICCIISVLLLTFYIREGEVGPVHAIRSVVTVVATPMRMVGSAVTGPFRAVGNVFSNLAAPQETLADLKQENEDLRAKVSELSESKSASSRLEALLNLKSAYNLQSTGAHVIGGSSDAWSQVVTIDKGTSDGLAINMPVVNAAGVIGQIVETSLNSSTVRLLADEKSGTSAMVQATRAQGMLHGQADGTLRLEYISVDSEVKAGDIVVTSGIGGVFPKGLPLGTVTSAEKAPNAVFYDIVVRPASSTQSNEEILVITSLAEGQAASDDDVALADTSPQGEGRGQDSSGGSSKGADPKSGDGGSGGKNKKE